MEETTYFEESGEYMLIDSNGENDYEARVSYDYTVERVVNGTRVLDYNWDYIELVVGHRWGDHFSLSFQSPEELDKFITGLVEFQSKVKDVWKRAKDSKPEDWSAS